MRFRVVGEVTVSAYTYVEADSAEEALRMACERECTLTTGNRSIDREYAAECAVIDDADGSFMPVRVESSPTVGGAKEEG